MKAWCVGYFYHGYLDQLIQTLTRKKEEFGDIEFWYPQISTLIIKDGKKVIEKEPIFENYMLFLIDTDSLIWTDILKFTPIMKFLKSSHNNELIFVTPEEVKHLKELESAKRIENYTFLVNQQVIVKKGPYKGMEGYCKSIIKGRYKARVYVNLFNIVKKEVEINIEDLDLIS